MSSIDSLLSQKPFPKIFERTSIIHGRLPEPWEGIFQRSLRVTGTPRITIRTAVVEQDETRKTFADRLKPRLCRLERYQEGYLMTFEPIAFSNKAAFGSACFRLLEKLGTIERDGHMPTKPLEYAFRISLPNLALTYVYTLKSYLRL